jgi:hypothetical protein
MLVWSTGEPKGAEGIQNGEPKSSTGKRRIAYFNAHFGDYGLVRCSSFGRNTYDAPLTICYIHVGGARTI